MSVEWGSFLLGGVVFSFFVGPFGILIGSLVRMADRGINQSDEIPNIFKEAMSLPKGEIVNLTIGHDVFIDSPGTEGQENFWERN